MERKSDANKQPVQVIVRVRPLSNSTAGYITTLNDSVSITNPRNSSEIIKYTFNRVFPQDAIQSDIFTTVKSLVLDQVSKGKNATVFAYGQTGSGKTHTMNGTASDRGIIPRTIEWLLLKGSISIQASYLEIYNEKIYDLLDSSEKTAGSYLDLRETSDKEIIVAGITNVSIKSMSDFNKYHQKALDKRATAATKLNHASSRSHFILQLIVKQTIGHKQLSSKLHLIDLAGSEDNKRTGNAGARMNESCAINKSLFVLGQVVEALNKQSIRVPYRDSKITRFLQDSLGGNAIGLMIACCSPKDENFTDTYNTLNFATKSSLIKNVVTVNQKVIEEKEKPKEDNSRKDALQQWKNSTKKAGLPPPKRVRLSQDSVNSAQSDLVFAPTELEFEKRVNSIVEERVKEILRKDQISRKLEKAKLILDEKLKQNTEKIEKPEIEKENQPSSANLDSLKEAASQNILHILNRGNQKAIMTLKMIGKKRADAILEARVADGEFTSLMDLERAGLKQSQISSILKANIDL